MLDWQLTVPGEHGHRGAAAVAHVVVATDPAPDNATHPRRPWEAATAVDLPLTHSLVTWQSAQVGKCHDGMISCKVYIRYLLS